MSKEGELKQQLAPIGKRFDDFMDGEYNDYSHQYETKISDIVDAAKKEIMEAAEQGEDMAVHNALWDALYKWFGSDAEVKNK